jgi:hypothetical protein
MGRRGRRSMQLLDEIKETKLYWKLKEEELHRSVWRTLSEVTDFSKERLRRDRYQGRREAPK